MKILLLTTHINAGGITSYLLTLCKGLIKNNCQVHLVSSGGDKEQQFLDMGVKLFTIDLKTKSELSLKIYWNIPRLRRYINEQNINIIHAQTRVTQVLAFWLSRFTNIIFVSTCHGFFKVRLSRKIFPCWGQGVIAVSSAVQEHLVRDFKIDSKIISLIPNGIDLTQFSILNRTEKLQIRKRLDLGDDVLIGLTARLSDVKGQDILIKAFGKIAEQFPQAKLILVGKGKFESSLRKLADSLQLNDRIIFRLTTENIFDYLAVLDVFVAPSRQEGLGLSILEAQASGLPVIASRVGGIPGIIEDGKTGLLVESENPEALAIAIKRILSETALADQFRQTARTFVAENFSEQQMVEKTLEFYNAKQKIKK
ncbi:MAG: glycosyltransferase family 4 protein [Candidatus Omnitrophica bacterium]|nr:glycosyltransferase family 4 protein [Candidatus Omnitrophota bacterium]MCB9746859.1 glycosyltransferase family 4 protein [Candidatus Omnitrophota bacterium]